MSDTRAKKRDYRAPALEKGLDVLELLAANRGGLTLTQISSALERSSSELFRMVQVLEARGYVGRAADEDGLILTNKLFALGMARAPAKDLLEAALPTMRAVCPRIGQSCHLAVASGDQMVVVARVEAPGDQGFRSVSAIDARSSRRPRVWCCTPSRRRASVDAGAKS